VYRLIGCAQCALQRMLESVTNLCVLNVGVALQPVWQL
jgi:hypothetical protein